MRLNQVRDFLAVVNAGSISAAARALGTSQPGLTKSLGALERELGISLLRRTPRGVVPTRYGRAFYVRAKVAHSELQKAGDEMAQMAGAGGGRAAVGFGPFIAAQVVPEAVRRFRCQQPDVELRLIEGFAHALLPLVRDETLDLLFAPRLPGLRNDPAIRFKPVFHHNLTVVARRGHPLGKVRSAAELAGTEWLCFEPREVTERWLSALGVPTPRKITQCESLNALLSLLACTDMLAISSHRVRQFAQAERTLQEIMLSERLPTMTVGLYTRADTPLTPAVATLARMLTEVGREIYSIAG